MTYDCIHGRSPVYFRDICSPIVSVPFCSRLRLLTTMTWLCHVLGPRVKVRAVSASWHLRFGTCCHLISRTVMLVANSSSRALRLGSLCKPTHKRPLWELCLSSALQMLDLIWFDLIWSSRTQSLRVSTVLMMVTDVVLQAEMRSTERAKAVFYRLLQHCPWAKV